MLPTPSKYGRRDQSEPCCIHALCDVLMLRFQIRAYPSNQCHPCSLLLDECYSINPNNKFNQYRQVTIYSTLPNFAHGTQPEVLKVNIIVFMKLCMIFIKLKKKNLSGQGVGVLKNVNPLNSTINFLIDIFFHFVHGANHPSSFLF